MPTDLFSAPHDPTWGEPTPPHHPRTQEDGQRADTSVPSSGKDWTAAQTAAVAAAEAIAATAASEVAAEAAATAEEAVTVALAAAVRAAAKARGVAADAVVAAAAAAVADAALDPRDAPPHAAGQGSPLGDGATGPERAAGDEQPLTAATVAAAKVAIRVTAVATAAAIAAVEAAALVGDQLAKDVAATAVAVDAATTPSRAPRLSRTRDSLIPAPWPPDARDDIALAADLRVGITADQLHLDFQPVVDLFTGRTSGVEALVRWQHPELGLLGPLVFVPVAEQGGLAVQLGAWVLDEACRVAVSLPLHDAERLTVAVNLSGLEISDPQLADRVQATLKAHGCIPDQILFEVTETAMVTDMAVAVHTLRELQVLGAHVAIDDFGTGYSSMSYLQQLAPDRIKIDRSFISGLGGAPHETAIVASLITLAHNLGVSCVAEGVETVRQLDLLKQLGCDFAQGYLFSRPLDEGALKTWLAEQRAPHARPRALAAQASPELARIVAMHQSGARPHTIASALNADGARTPSGSRWSALRVTRALARGRRPSSGDLTLGRRPR